MKEWHSEHKEEQRAYYARPEIRQRTNAYHRGYTKRPHARNRIKAYYHRQDVRNHVNAFYRTPEQKERRQQYYTEYSRRPEVQDRQRDYTAQYHQRPGVKEHRQDLYYVYYARPDVKARLSVVRHRRRARLRNAPGSHTPTQLMEQHARQRGKCYYCKKKVVWGEHHIDHIQPLSRGGSNDISNLVVTCPYCNLSKNDRLPSEWPQGNRLL
jgi:5-methylcytosine-specific restriction endonuclease McrA